MYYRKEWRSLNSLTRWVSLAGDSKFRRNVGVIIDYTTTVWIYIVVQTPHPVTAVCLPYSAIRSSCSDFIVNQNQLWRDVTRDLSQNDGYRETEENCYFLIHVLWSVLRMQVISTKSSVRPGAVWDDDHAGVAISVTVGSLLGLHDGKSVNTMCYNVVIAPLWRFVHTLPVVMMIINSVTLFM